MVLADIILESIRVASSSVKTGDNEIILRISGATANLTMNWEFIYSTWLLPIMVSDKGTTSAQFGGWLWKEYQLCIEVALSNKIKESIVKLDTFLQSIPKEVALSDFAAMNITVLDDLELSDSILLLKLNGLLSPVDEAMLSKQYGRSGQMSLTCKKADKMVKFSFQEDVLKSASSVYFEAGKMHWIVNKTSDLSLLNTYWWKFIIPDLYNMYPNRNMNLNLTVSSPPTIEVGNQQITTIIPLDVMVNVVDAKEVVSVTSYPW